MPRAATYSNRHAAVMQRFAVRPADSERIASALQLNSKSSMMAVRNGP